MSGKIINFNERGHWCFIQITEPTWALGIRRKLVDLEDTSRRNNLRILCIKEDPRES